MGPSENSRLKKQGPRRAPENRVRPALGLLYLSPGFGLWALAVDNARQEEFSSSRRVEVKTRLTVLMMMAAALAVCPSSSSAQTWGFPGLNNPEFNAVTPGAPAPRRDLTGAWDPGQAGIAGGENY